MSRKLSPEAKLAAYWRKRAGLAYSDFDAILGVEKPAGVGSREPAYDVLQPGVHRSASADGLTIKDLRHNLAWLVSSHYPLSFGEYHLAIAFGFLLTDGIPYLTFYRTRWHETATHRAHGPARSCGACKRERPNERRLAAPRKGNP